MSKKIENILLPLLLAYDAKDLSEVASKVLNNNTTLDEVTEKYTKWLSTAPSIMVQLATLKNRIVLNTINMQLASEAKRLEFINDEEIIKIHKGVATKMKAQFDFSNKEALADIKKSEVMESEYGGRIAELMMIDTYIRRTFRALGGEA